MRLRTAHIGSLHVQDVIARPLRLGSGVDDQLAVIAQILE